MCGRPRAAAKDILADKESFDRGFYSGPFGWLSGSAAEFVVAIRSALLHATPTNLPSDSLLAVCVKPATPNADLLAQQLSNGAHSNNGPASYPNSLPNLASTDQNPATGNAKGRLSGPDTRTISLFAGVGIVKGSDAESEWQVSHVTHSSCGMW